MGFLGGVLRLRSSIRCFSELSSNAFRHISSPRKDQPRWYLDHVRNLTGNLETMSPRELCLSASWFLRNPTLLLKDRDISQTDSRMFQKIFLKKSKESIETTYWNVSDVLDLYSHIVRLRRDNQFMNCAIPLVTAIHDFAVKELSEFTPEQLRSFMHKMSLYRHVFQEEKVHIKALSVCEEAMATEPLQPRVLSTVLQSAAQSRFVGNEEIQRKLLGLLRMASEDLVNSWDDETRSWNNDWPSIYRILNAFCILRVRECDLFYFVRRKFIQSEKMNNMDLCTLHGLLFSMTSLKSTSEQSLLKFSSLLSEMLDNGISMNDSKYVCPILTLLASNGHLDALLLNTAKTALRKVNPDLETLLDRRHLRSLKYLESECSLNRNVIEDPLNFY